MNVKNEKLSILNEFHFSNKHDGDEDGNKVDQKVKNDEEIGIKQGHDGVKNGSKSGHAKEHVEEVDIGAMVTKESDNQSNGHGDDSSYTLRDQQVILVQLSPQFILLFPFRILVQYLSSETNLRHFVGKEHQHDQQEQTLQDQDS